MFEQQIMRLQQWQQVRENDTERFESSHYFEVCWTSAEITAENPDCIYVSSGYTSQDKGNSVQFCNWR